MAIALLITPGASATQHLVKPGDPWSDLAPRLRPGDEIILMPGAHRSGSLDDVAGTAERPIVIRGLDPDHPAVIEGGREGIRLRRPHHVVIRNLKITGATIAGISITDEPEPSLPPGLPRDILEESKAYEPGDEPWPAHVTIRDVTIEKTGPQGRRHGIRLAAVEHVRIERTTISGWGGAAVKLIASSNVTIEKCEMRGLAGHGQVSGVHIRAGSENIKIRHCTIIDAGDSAIAFGGLSEADDFRPPLTERSTDQRVHEARNVAVERCILQGGQSGLAFLSADRCTIRNNLIVNPLRWAYFIAVQPSPQGADARTLERTQPVDDVQQCVFRSNMIVWQPKTLRTLTFLQPPAKADGLVIEQNLWWSSDLEETRDALGDPVGTVRAKQILDVDPELDEDRKARNRRARMYGTEGP